VTTPYSLGELQALNRAVKEIPTEPILYITAAKLQEAYGDVSMVPKIISRAIHRKLPENGVVIDRETWLKEAETAEKASPPMTETCRAIVSAVIDVAVDERERKDTYFRDADEAARRGSVHTARAILQHACEVFPDSERSWRTFADLEKSNGATLALRKVLFCCGLYVYVYVCTAASMLCQ
jgi:pre-mRNA-processing factor 6